MKSIIYVNVCQDYYRYQVAASRSSIAEGPESRTHSFLPHNSVLREDAAMHYDCAASMKPAHPNYDFEFIYTTHPVPYEVAWYKWEFLRRNPEYQADFKKFIHKFGSWFSRKGYWFDHDRRDANWTKSDENYFYAKIAPVIARICQKWQTGNLFPPEWQFDKNLETRKIGSRVVGPPTGIPPELNWDFGVMRQLLERGFTGTADSARRYRNLLLIEFDMKRPMKDLVKYAKYVLTRAMKNYEQECQELGLKSSKSRRRFTDYHTHLRIWDLKQENKTNLEIASLIFPRELPDIARQKVRDHLKTAQKLISGHYKGIR